MSSPWGHDAVEKYAFPPLALSSPNPASEKLDNRRKRGRSRTPAASGNNPEPQAHRQNKLTVPTSSNVFLGRLDARLATGTGGLMRSRWLAAVDPKTAFWEIYSREVGFTALISLLGVMRPVRDDAGLLQWVKRRQRCGD
jgi:hypothetical protein